MILVQGHDTLSNEGQFLCIKCVFILLWTLRTHKNFFFARNKNKFCLTPNLTIKCQFQLQSIYSMIKNSSKIYIPSTVNTLLKKL